jgi:uncharacterized protein involved in outer membrane biogenesis
MTVLKWVGIGFLALVAVVVGGAGIALALFDPNDARGFIARQASSALGREVAIDGNLSVDWGDPIHIHVEGVRVANVEWSDEKNMAELKALDALLRLWPLLRGDFEFPELRFTEPRAILEKNEEEQNNWSFAADPRKEAAKETVEPESRADIPIIERLVITDGRLRYRDPTSDIDIDSGINTATGASGQEQVRLNGQGNFAGKPFTLAIEGGSLQYLRDDPKPYPLKVQTAVGNTKGKIEGSIAEPVRMEGVDLSVELSGEDMAEIFPILGIPTPKTRDYGLSGHLTRQGAVWRFEGMKGRVGESDLSGMVAVDTGGERPKVTGDLTSNRLAAVDLAGFVGASPRGPDDYETKARGRILPATEINVEKLRNADMDVRFKGNRVEAPFAPLQDIDTHILLENGRMTVDPLKLGIGGGRIAGTAMLDGSGKVPALRTSMELRRIQLAQFFKDTPFAKEMGGIINGHLELAGQGRTVAGLLASADGKLGLAVDGGRISNLAISGLKTNVLEALGILLTGDEPLPFNCLVGDVAIENGVARIQALVLDTPETLVTGEGTVDLRNEALRLNVRGRSKEAQAFATHVPVLVRGTLGNPDIGVDATESVARGAAAVALGVLLTPLASILPLLDTGTDEEAHCGQLIQNAKSPSRSGTGSGGSQGQEQAPSGSDR